ncbi:MAG: carbohydrate-binding family 9-like protein [Candidatus Glassbacteria bacterium]|nr:carbohydrate-binding family 9-like protein [Candidatus Glassbacteria bacterium]
MTGKMLYLIAAGLLSASIAAGPAVSAPAPATRHYVVKRTPAPIFADGKLDEPAWQKCARIDLVNKSGGPPEQATTAMMLWDDRYLYIAFDCWDTHIWSTLTQHDEALYNEEVVEVFIDADSDGETYVEFEVNPLGALFDGYLLNRSGKRDLILAWNSELIRWGVQVNGTLNDPADTDVGWTVEYAIPLADIATGPHTPPQAGDKWRVNLYRIDVPQGKGGALQGTAWSPVSGRTFHDPDRFGEVEFSDEVVK